MDGYEQALRALVSGGIIGLSLGVTGSGGSLLAIPLLVYLVQTDVRQATAIALFVVGATAWLGVFQHRTDGTIRPKAAVVFSGTGVVTAWAGAWVHHLVREDTLLVLLGGLMIVAGLLMLPQAPHSSASARPGQCAEQFPRSCWIKVAGIGSFIGFLTGFFGIGGGFLIVPALVLLLGFPMKLAVSTSLLIIALMTIGGFLGHLSFGAVDWHLLGWLLAGSTLGLLLGKPLGQALPQPFRLQTFAVLTIVLGLALIAHNGASFLQE